MRVTNKLMADTVFRNLSSHTERLFHIQNMISSGKRINKPSDDPIGIARVLGYRKTISSIDQYSRNIAHGKSWLSLADSTLGSVDTLLIRAKEVAVYQATETSSPETRLIAAEEVRNIYEQIMQLSNTKSGNSYIFSGHKTDTASFSYDADYNANYAGDSGDIKVLVGEEIGISININGRDTFQSGDGNGGCIFQVLKDLKDGLEANDTSQISEQVDLLSDSLNQVLKKRAELGARINRLESTESYWVDFKLNVQESLVETEDVDLTQVIADLMSQQTAYQASLNAAGKVIQPSLIDFLR